MNRSSLVPRWLYLAFACVMLALGIIGIVLPGLPTTPFILLAAWAAARGSTRLHRWLIEHRTFGPLIRDWQAQGAVRRGNKWLATITMLACAVILLLTAPRLWMAATGISVMLLTGIWLWLRPEPCAISSKDEEAGQGH
jgi:uncharacterized membrane protein YbaN (DUF454 family)